MLIRLDNLLTGQIAPLGEKASAIAKTPVEGKIFLTHTSFSSDQQADLKNHGGLEKAVHHYPRDHYALWREEIGEQSVLKQAGAFGENLSTTGMTEKTVAIGDQFRLGSAIIEVSQGRQPCWKLNIRFNTPDMAIRVQKTGRSGWYYRVIEEGYVCAGDEFQLLHRTSPEWTIHRLWHTLYIDTLNYDELAAMAALKHLPEGWRRYAVRRIENRKVEDWSARLEGKTP